MNQRFLSAQTSLRGTDSGRSAETAARAAERGFTLLELLVVLGILGLLAAIAAPRVIAYLGSARSDTARIQMNSIATALDLYRLENGRYPAEADGLKALVENAAGSAGWNGPYLKGQDGIVDPWGQPYQYKLPGLHGEYDLFTLGADNAPGGEGEDSDVTSW
ncbi:type II secretion system major pseudopilin GspG [Pelagibius sp. 7325]|uniref:type II secretion system major pseudopilin GspG n=1 Tax=Pelagibius sp. 7325 TaxID=3131994 RepID=UPI0030EE019D